MRVTLPLAAVVLLSGCDGRAVAPVSGRVTLDGQPLANVLVVFEPINGNNPGLGSVGRTDADGRFVLRQIQPDRPGALVGQHRVRFRTAPRGIAREDAIEKELLPAAFNKESKLTYVLAGP